MSQLGRTAVRQRGGLTSAYGEFSMSIDIVVDDHQLLDLIAQIDPADRPITRDDLTQLAAAVVAADIAA
jgi:hypothetical protein